MTSNDSPATDNDQVHAGYDLETGLLAQMREWIDIFPCLRLARITRAMGSPPLLGLVALTFAVWKIGIVFMMPEDVSAYYSEVATTAGQQSAFLTDHLQNLNPTTIFHENSTMTWWRTSLGICWSVMIWAPMAILLSRQGGLLAAGRPMMPLSSAIHLALSRTLAGWLTAVIPLGLTTVIASGILCAGWLSGVAGSITWINSMLAAITLLLAIPCGLLAFGANIAIPLSWAALANERDPDTMDSLSRGYEYLLRRPLHLALYVLLAVGITVVIAILATGITTAAIQISCQILAFSGATDAMIETSKNVLANLPIVVLFTAAGSLLGGVYLLLRFDAGGQEVEDLWEVKIHPEPPLPSLSDDSPDPATDGSADSKA